MTRKEELLNLFKDADENKKIVFFNLVDDIVFIENQLIALKKMPFIKVHPKNKYLQKSTPAAKQYKELLQQYNNSLKLLCSIIHNVDDKEESPLRKFLRTLEND